jgi:anti-sigma B factor antagonist
MAYITSTQFGHMNVITIKGQLEAETASKLNQITQELIKKNQLNIALDLSETALLSSAGLRVLVSTLKATRPRGGDLCLINPSERSLEALRLAGLVAVFKVYPSLQEAVG